MKKKIYLTIISLITVVCILLGIGIHCTNWGWLDAIRPGNLRLEEYETALSDVKDNITITVDCRLGDVEIKRGSDFHISYSAAESLETQVDTSEDSITITQKSKIKNFRTKGGEISLTVPSNVTIEMIDIQNDLGDIDIEGLTFKEAKISENLGDIKVTDSTFDILQITNDLGDVSVLNCGDYENYNVNLKVSLGDIKFLDGKYSGSFVRSGDAGTLHIEDSLGDIKVE